MTYSTTSMAEGRFRCKAEESDEQDLPRGQGRGCNWTTGLSLGEAGSGILQKAKWRGPARVVAKETNEDGKVLILWLTHGTSLVRCAPHQVRPKVEEQGCSVAADPSAALKDLQEVRARSTTQFKDITDAEPQVEDMADDRTDYEPNLMGDDEAAEHMAAMRMPLPGIVSNLLTHGEVERERMPRRRRPSVDEPEPTPGSRRDDQDDDNSDGPGDGAGPGGDETKRRKQTSRKAKEKQSRGDSGAAGSEQHQQAGGAADAAEETTMTEEVISRPVHVPIPNDEMDGNELMVEDVLITEVSDLPEGWIIVDNGLELSDAWVVQNPRKNEANEKKMTSEERAMMPAAKAKELSQFFQNEVWEFADDMTPGDIKRTITARCVLTWKVDEETGLPKAKARLVLYVDLRTLTLQR